MRPSGDYLGEMPSTNVLDREVELLLAGAPIEGGRLSGLAPVMAMIRAQWTTVPSESEIAQFARSAVAEVKVPQSAPTAVTPLRRQRGAGQWSLTPRLATVAMGVLLMSGTAGAALAADGAVPGDALYGLDRAFERVGIGSGSTDERLDEAVVIAAQGRSEEAVAHAIEALGGQSDDQSVVALTALTVASENLVHAQDTAQAAATANIRVSALLTYIAENIGPDRGTDGREFGQGVAQLARDIGGGDDPNGAQDPSVAPAPGQGQSSNPGAGAGNQGSNEGSGPGNGSSNGNGEDNGPPAESPSVTAPGQDNGPPAESPSVTAPNQDNGPPAESPSVTAPNQDNGPPAESPSVTAPSRGTNTEDSPAATAPGQEKKP